MTKKKILFFIFFLLINSFSFFINADNIKEIKSGIEKQKQQIKKIDKEIKQEQSNLSLIKEKEEKIKVSIENLEKSQKEISKSILTTESNIGKVKKDIKDLKNNIDKKNKEIEKNKELISQNLRMVNRVQQINPVLIFLSSNRFSDFINSFVFINRLNSVLSEQTRKVISKKEQLEVLKQKEEKNEAVLVGYRNDLDNQNKQLDKAKKEKKSLLVESERLKGEKEKIIAEKKLAKKQFEQELYDLESKLPQIDTSYLNNQSTEGFGLPFAGHYRITQPFGTASKFHMRLYKDGKGHNGVDFATPIGTHVLSIADGVVTDTGDSTKVCRGVQYGKWILIKHNNGTSSMYAHLSVIGVSKGQKVRKGQYIGKSGDTGYTFGAHLHISMYATKAVQVKMHKHSFHGRCYGKIMKLPISPWSGYLDPLKYIPAKWNGNEG